MLDTIDVSSLVARIESEYREMPGLQLTARQMQRMWCLDEPTCEAVIGTLVAHRIVVKTRRDAYARADRQENAAAACQADPSECLTAGAARDVDLMDMTIR